MENGTKYGQDKVTWNMGHNIGQDQVKLNMGQDVTVDTMTGPSKMEYSKGY